MSLIRHPVKSSLINQVQPVATAITNSIQRWNLSYVRNILEKEQKLDKLCKLKISKDRWFMYNEDTSYNKRLYSNVDVDLIQEMTNNNMLRMFEKRPNNGFTVDKVGYIMFINELKSTYLLLYQGTYIFYD